MGAPKEQEMNTFDPNNVYLLISNNCSYPSPPTRYFLKYPPSTPLQTVIEKITELTNYEEDHFLLVKGTLKLTDFTKTLSELDFVPGKKSLLHLNPRPGIPLEEFSKKQNIENSNNTPPSTSFINSPQSTAVVPYGGAGNNNNSSHSGASSSFDWNRKSKTGFVGLSNQGATCYMNSLIQTLFMTPEFRIGLYKWNYEQTFQKWLQNKAKEQSNPQPTETSQDPSKSNSNKEPKTEEELLREWAHDSIPRQLQLLFSRLELRDQRAVKTKDLTASFGWNESDAFTQHDVQELCRVLFDALEKVFAGTEQENLINELYQGEMKDYVKCSVCQTESSRTDKYLDIPLVIRGFGESKAISSVEEALEKFTTPELLNGENQYFCEKCNKKVDATKGLKYTSFPYLLTLQLKRFDFDYETFRRIKINDRVTFPFILNMNPFLADNEDKSKKKRKRSNLNQNLNSMEIEDEQEDAMEEEEEDENSKKRVDYKNEKMCDDDEFENKESRGVPLKGYGGDEEEDRQEEMEGDDPRENALHNSQKYSKNSKQEVLEEEEEMEGEEEDIVKDYLEQGPCVYELYSVLVHRGSALGGHYYAYIKSLDTGKWYEFNDSMVSEISEEDVVKTYGDTPEERRGGMMSYFQSSANAYMLLYRKIDPERNCKLPKVKEVNPGLAKVLEEEIERSKRKKAEKEREREMVNITIHYSGGEKTVKLHNSTLLKNLVLKAAEIYNLLDKFPEDCFRLRNYQTQYQLPAEPLDQPHQLKKTLEELNFFSSKSLLLETKLPGDSFPLYNPSDMLLRLVFYDSETQKFKLEEIYIPREATLGDLKQLAEMKFQIPVSDQRVIKEAWTYQGPLAKILSGDEDELREQRIFEGMKVYIESNQIEENSSPSFLEIERLKNLIEIKFTSPDKDEFDYVVTVSKKITLKQLKQIISEKVLLPMEEFKISRGHVNWKYELKNEESTLEDLFLSDGFKIYVEKGKPMKEGQVKINFVLFQPQVDPEHSGIVFLTPEIFSPTQQENTPEIEMKSLPDENQPFSNNNQGISQVSEPETIQTNQMEENGTKNHSIESQKLTNGETNLNSNLNSPISTNDAESNHSSPSSFSQNKKGEFEDLFEINLDETMQVYDLKVELAKKLNEEKKIQVDPNFIRLREIISRSPGKIFPTNATLKDTVHVLYNGKNLGITILDQPECIVSSKQISLFIIPWFPAKYQVGTKFEIIIHEDVLISDLKLFLSRRFRIPNVGLAKAHTYPGVELLDIPGLDWDRPIPEYLSTRSGTLGSAPLYLRDGDILYFRNNDEPEKQLTKEEKKKLEIEMIKKRNAHYYSKEEALHINVKT